MFTAAQVNVFVADVEASTAFFTDACGFTETFRTPRDQPPEHVEMVLGGMKLALSSHAAALRVIGIDTDRPPSSEITLWCDDARAAHAKLLAAGAVEVTAPQQHGANVSGWCREPGGALVGVVAPAEDA